MSLQFQLERGALRHHHHLLDTIEKEGEDGRSTLKHVKGMIAILVGIKICFISSVPLGSQYGDIELKILQSFSTLYYKIYFHTISFK